MAKTDKNNSDKAFEATLLGAVVLAGGVTGAGIVHDPDDAAEFTEKQTTAIVQAPTPSPAAADLQEDTQGKILVAAQPNTSENFIEVDAEKVFDELRKIRGYDKLYEGKTRDELDKETPRLVANKTVFARRLNNTRFIDIFVGNPNILRATVILNSNGTIDVRVPVWNRSGGTAVFGRNIKIVQLSQLFDELVPEFEGNENEKNADAEHGEEKTKNILVDYVERINTIFNNVEG